MAELKTKKTQASVREFLEGVEDEGRRKDGFTVAKLMQRITGAKPKMWGPGIIGFGDYRYKYESGREGDWFVTGFSPRKQNLTLYIGSGFDRYEDLLAKLGKFKTGKGCLYVKRLEDVDMRTLETLIRQSVRHTTAQGA